MILLFFKLVWLLTNLDHAQSRAFWINQTATLSEAPEDVAP